MFVIFLFFFCRSRPGLARVLKWVALLGALPAGLRGLCAKALSCVAILQGCIMTESDHDQRRSLSRRVARRLTGMVRVAPLLRSDTRFRLSFAFDDCPDSACDPRGPDSGNKGACTRRFSSRRACWGKMVCPARSQHQAGFANWPRAGMRLRCTPMRIDDLTHLSVTQAVEDVTRNIKGIGETFLARPLARISRIPLAKQRCR